MANPFATILVSSRILALAENSLHVQFALLEQASWAGSTNVLLIWPLTPWAAVAIGPMNLSVPKGFEQAFIRLLNRQLTPNFAE